LPGKELTFPKTAQYLEQTALSEPKDSHEAAETFEETTSEALKMSWTGRSNLGNMGRNIKQVALSEPGDDSKTAKLSKRQPKTL
jgi:hypothetical protein